MDDEKADDGPVMRCERGKLHCFDVFQRCRKCLTRVLQVRWAERGAAPNPGTTALLPSTNMSAPASPGAGPRPTAIDGVTR